MIKKSPILLLFIFASGLAQDKVKGSRNVKTEQHELAPFHTIEMTGEFKIGILKGRQPQVEIKADDNVHDLILTDVRDGVLYIKPIKQLVRTKALELKVTFADTLRSLLVGGEVEMESLQDIYVKDFTLETSNDAKVYLTITSNKFKLVNGDGAKAQLNVTAQEIVCQLNQSSKVEALFNAPLMDIDLYEKASGKIEGETAELQLRLDQSSKFEGENLAALKANVLAQGNSEAKVNAKDSINVSLSGKSELEIYNQPHIVLDKFTDEAKLAKKEFSRGLFK
ncbi:GIN domain-containing protein [Christiangramia aquimixticola]|uniref:GIN domain-containing protein n=1 Tax=Christiangramia aquimixticola TaxID=1697558 RepID=UPI003AA9E0B5